LQASNSLSFSIHFNPTIGHRFLALKERHSIARCSAPGWQGFIILKTSLFAMSLYFRFTANWLDPTAFFALLPIQVSPLRFSTVMFAPLIAFLIALIA
jgi:hypothetical protein